MPRKPRMYLPDVPCHVIQRGNNREDSFYSEED
ncbi:MAG: transposase, partial [endosymbiont of Galathealinum brachiosum]